jgi:LPS sulfotransferase NodH
MTIVHKIQRRLREEFASASKIAVEKRLLPGNDKYTRFVIISDIRSGSTMLGSYLSSHPAVVCFFELFHNHQESVPFGVTGYQKRGNKSSVVALRNSNPVRFLQTYIFNRHLPGAQAVGFKLLYTQGHCRSTWWHEADYNHWWRGGSAPPLLPRDQSDLWNYLQCEDQIVIIHLIRRNYLERLISFHKARLTGRWGEGATGGYGADEQIQIEVDPLELSRDLNALDRFESETDEKFARHKSIKITYEDMITDAPTALARVSKVLGIADMGMWTKTLKQNKQSVRSSIRNFETLRSKFAGTKWEYLFSDQ